MIKSKIPTKKNVVQVFNFILCFLLATSCVTVNVNFPESAVQKATDDYVRELYRVKKKSTSNSPATSMEHFSALPLLTLLSLSSTFGFANQDILIQSSKTKTVLERQSTRIEEILDFKRKGDIGETNDGKLVLKSEDKTKKILIKKIEALIEAENQDRATLYNEVLQLNHFAPSQLKSIAISFARSFQSESPSGAWVQSDAGQWSKKP